MTNDKFKIQLITAAILALGGLILLFCGTYIDPQGQIHETLLVAFGEVLTFSGSLMGIDYHYKSKHYVQDHLNTTKQDGQSGEGQNDHPV